MAGDGLPDVRHPRPAADRDRPATGRAFHGTGDRRVRVPDAVRHPARRAAPAGRGRAHGAGLRALRRGVVRLPDAPAGRTPGQPDVLRPRAASRRAELVDRDASRSSAAARSARRCCPGCCAAAHAGRRSSSVEKHPERAPPTWPSTYGVAAVDVAGRGRRGPHVLISRSSRRTSTRCWPSWRRTSTPRARGGLGRPPASRPRASRRRCAAGVAGRARACRTPRPWSTRR